MAKTKSGFQSLAEVTSIREDHPFLRLEFENGFQHIRRFENNSLQIQISKDPIPQFSSYSIISDQLLPLDWEEDDQILEIRAEGSFFLDMDSGQWQWNQAPWTLFQSEEGLGFGFLGEETIAALHLETHQNFFGLGEKTGSLNRRGSAFVNWNTDAFAYTDGRDPLYVSIPFYLSVHQGICYGLLVDNSCKTRFNFGASNKRMVQISASSGPLNLIFIPGPHPADVLRRYHELTGPMAIPPKWALGLQQCRYSYYPDHEVLELARNFRYRNIPCDVLYLDIHYMDQYKVFTVDKSRFPNLKEMCDALLSMGFRVVPIQDPGIKEEPGYFPYDSGKKENLFVRYPDGKHWVAGVWPGDCVFPDFTDPSARRWWSDLTQNWVKETGVRGLWNDMNEPATWGQDVPDMLEFDMDGNGGSHREAHNIYGQLMAASTRDGLEKAYPGERNFVLTRAGFSGIHRYAAVWSGDNVSNEEHYFLGIRLVLGMAMSGVSFSGPDVGGFVGDSGRNLFVRWISVASFFPFFRLHSMIDSRDNEPWSYGELAEAIAGNYIRLRYRLLPCLYSTIHHSHRTGMPVLKPYFWEKEGLEFNPAFQHQFFFCKNLLVVPAASDQNAVLGELPAGTWFHLFSGEKETGPKEFWMASPADCLPVWVREGSILVTRPHGKFSLDPEAKGHTVHIFYGNGTYEFQWVEDDGLLEEADPDQEMELKIQMDFSQNALSWKLEKGGMKPGIVDICLWHFPSDVRSIRLNGVAREAVAGQFVWLDDLPNFDPFEDKGKHYYSTCLRITV